ncbi:MAG: sigma-70 family RNA polymerase sigma factor [Gemmatimonadaceae bacterium]|nr:sigma-70 family RNA polymerase sigma factor [Gemmatimonadaceae bacterium]
MSRFDRISQDPPAGLGPTGRVPLDERFISLLLPDSPLDLVESQELRQVVTGALERLNPRELEVVKLRYQEKRSPGAVAALLRLSRQEVRDLEGGALEKLREPLVEYLEL